MFIELKYLAADPSKPNFNDDPEMQEIIGTDNESWLRVKLDLSTVQNIYEMPKKDRCAVQYYNGTEDIVLMSYDDLSAKHNEYFLTLKQMQEALRDPVAEFNIQTLPKGQA